MDDKKQNNKATTTNNRPTEPEIDLVGLLQKLLAKRKLIYKAIGVGVFIGLIISISLPRKYTVTVTLSPEMSGSSRGGNELAGLASSFLGTNMSSNSDALNVSLSSDIVASTPFVLELFNIKVQTIDNRVDTTLYAYLDEQEVPWWGYIMKAPSLLFEGIRRLSGSEKESTANTLDPFQLTREEDRKVTELKKSIIASIDKKTSITTLSVTLQDPKVTAIVADSVVNKLQQYIINYRIAKAKEDCNYLENLYKERQQEYYDAQSKYAQYMDANRSLVLQTVRTEQERLQNDMNLAYQVYSQVAQQLQLARAKIQEEKPVFAVLEPATIPLTPSGAGKKVIILAFAFLGILCSSAWILFGQECIALFKKKEEDKDKAEA